MGAAVSIAAPHNTGLSPGFGPPRALIGTWRPPPVDTKHLVSESIEKKTDANEATRSLAVEKSVVAEPLIVIDANQLAGIIALETVHAPATLHYAHNYLR
jgi:hypothetical protein